MPPMMPQGGAAPPAAGGGGDMMSQLAQLAGPLLSSPQGAQMVKAIMGQLQGGGGAGTGPAQFDSPPPPGGMEALNAMRAAAGGGGDPRGQMRGQGTMGRGPATDGELEGMDQTQGQMRPDRPMSTEDELNAASDQMGMHKPGGMDGGDGMVSPSDKGGMNQGQSPTPEEIQLLKSKPTPMNISNFDKLFGAGAAQQVLGGQGGGQAQASQGGQAPQGAGGEDGDGADSEGADDYD